MNTIATATLATILAIGAAIAYAPDHHKTTQETAFEESRKYCSDKEVSFMSCMESRGY